MKTKYHIEIAGEIGVVDAESVGDVPEQLGYSVLGQGQDGEETVFSVQHDGQPAMLLVVPFPGQPA